MQSLNIEQCLRTTLTVKPDALLSGDVAMLSSNVSTAAMANAVLKTNASSQMVYFMAT